MLRHSKQDHPCLSRTLFLLRKSAPGRRHLSALRISVWMEVLVQVWLRFCLSFFFLFLIMCGCLPWLQCFIFKFQNPPPLPCVLVTLVDFSLKDVAFRHLPCTWSELSWPSIFRNWVFEPVVLEESVCKSLNYWLEVTGNNRSQSQLSNSEWCVISKNPFKNN